MNEPTLRIGIDATALPSQPTGAGNYIIELVRALAEQPSGDRFVIFAQRSGRALIGPLPESVEWVTLPDRPIAQRLLWEQSGLPRLASRARLDLLHSPHYTQPLSLPCPSVVTFHDMTFFLFPHLHTRIKRLIFPRAIRLSARRASALIAVSESTRQDAIRLLDIPPEKIHAIPEGVSPAFRPIQDPDRLEAVRVHYGLPQTFILYVGVVEPRKNLPLLLEAYASLVEHGRPEPLVIVGRMGWMYDQVLEQIQELGLRERVQFAGYIPAQDLPIVYNLGKLFVYPSVYEGFGLPPLEAMACGTPVVTSAVSSMPEHVGQAGLLVPPNDARALAEAMQAVLESPELQQELSRKGPQRATQFTWKETASKTLKVYHSLNFRS